MMRCLILFIMLICSHVAYAYPVEVLYNTDSPVPCLPVIITNASDEPQTSVTYSSVTIYYKVGVSGTWTALSLTSASCTDANGTWCEEDSTNAPGSYRACNTTIDNTQGQLYYVVKGTNIKTRFYTGPVVAERVYESRASVVNIEDDTGTSGVVITQAAADKVWSDAATIGADSDAVNAIWSENIMTGYTGNSAGKKLKNLTAMITHSGMVLTAGANWVTFDSGSAIDGTYEEQLLVIYDGTGAGQAHHIVHYDYNVTGPVYKAWIDDDWETTPSTDSAFVLVGGSAHDTLAEGLAQAGGASTITLELTEPAVLDFYKDHIIEITSGAGIHQARRITGYTTGRVATVDSAWSTQPDANSGYYIYAIGQVVPADDSITAAKIAAGAIVKGDEITGFNDLSAAQVNAEVDTALNTAIPGSPTADSVNERVKAIDDKLPTNYIMGSAVLTAQDGVLANIETDTQNIQGRLPTALVGGKMDSFGSLLKQITVSAGTTASAITSAGSFTESSNRGYVGGIVNCPAATATENRPVFLKIISFNPATDTVTLNGSFPTVLTNGDVCNIYIDTIR